MIRSLLSRHAGWFLCTGATFASALVMRAQTPATSASADLPAVGAEKLVVSATRSPQDPRYTPSSVTLVPLADLAAAQITDLTTALSQQPGVVVVQTGAPGGPASVFMRGANSHQTLFVVDGVRMNDRSASYTNFLGAADLGGLGRMEILRGPQSTLYGSSAMGGVIVMDTATGRGPLHGSLAASGGSFESLGFGANAAGSSGPVGYSASINRSETANDLPGNDFKQWSGSGRLEYVVDNHLLFGATLRRADIDFQQTGSRLYPAPGTVATVNNLVTAYGEANSGDGFRSRLTLAQHDRHYTFADKWSTSDLTNRRRVADWLNTWQATPALELVGGANYEQAQYVVNGAPSYDRVSAGYASATYRPIKTVTLTGGARYDHFDTVGSATTWRTGVSWNVAATTHLRATYGTGFSAPGSDDRFGVAAWNQLPNPNLSPEKSKGWDAGIDQDLLGGKVTASATYFNNRFRNLFEWETTDFTTFAGRTVNRSRASTDGVEFALSAKPVSNVATRIAYTYLDATNGDNGRRLARRPRHTVDAEVRFDATSAFQLGVGAHSVADRVETSGPLAGYTTGRVFASYAIRRDFTARLRVENALDKKYEAVLGYPSLPRGVFGSIEWSF